MAKTSTAPTAAESDAFMLALFADLDATTFDLPPSSPLPTPSLPPSQPTTSHTHKAKQSHQLRPPNPSPFWRDPLSRPKLSSSQAPPSPKVFSPKKTTNYNKGKNSVGGMREVKRVEISLEGKENALRTTTTEVGREKKKVRVEVKKEVEEVDFDALLDDVDWGEEVMLSPVKKKEIPLVPQSRQYTRCVVREIIEASVEVEGGKKKPVKIISVTGTTFKDFRQVHLFDDWIETALELDDVINLIGPFSPLSTPSLLLTRQLPHLLIHHPDILVSSTKVADSSSCSRKALLQEIIRTVGGSNPSLIYGNMLHEVLQGVLLEGEERKDAVEKAVEGNVGEMWSCELGVERAKEEMMKRSEVFDAFGEMFVGEKPKSDAYLTDPRVNDSARARLAINETLAVEEDIWSPKYGLKGKIDVSVTGSIVEGPFTTKSILPFEIKTGRAIAGMEHRAQTMLYTLLMSDRYDEVIDSGLLYYTQSNQVMRVKAAHHELRGLVLARNEFATFLHRRMTLDKSDRWCKKEDEEEGRGEEKKMGDDEAALWGGQSSQTVVVEEERQLLPPPIDEARFCSKCYVVDACMLFRKAVDGDESISTDEDDPLQVLYESKTGHLTEEHQTFFRDWERMISLEEQELVRFKKEIWTMDAEERMKVGRCLANMTIDTTYEPPATQVPGAKIHRYTYRLHHATPFPSQTQSMSPSQQRAARSLLGGAISLNDPVAISLERPHVLALSRGFVLGITATEIILGLDHSLVDSPQATKAGVDLTVQGGGVFRIDKDELAAGMGRIRDNLIQLFVPIESKLRRLIVDLEEPKFDHAPPPAITLPSTKSSLNGDQQRAIEKVLSMNDYALILGMPGTGKTTTIAEVLQALTKRGKSVLLTSYTHSAVDNILLKVKDVQGLSILRLGNRDKIMPELHHLTLDPENKATSLTQLDNLLMTPQIVATTCLGISEPIFTKRRFDVCIVDEASQVTLPTCLGPLRFADSFVLVGDHNQLPPLVRNQSARAAGLDISLFKRLSEAHPSSLVYLTNQYRMNEDIMLLSNKLVYHDRLKVGDERTRRQVLELPDQSVREREGKKEGRKWLADLLDPERKVVFVDTDKLPAREHKRGPLVDNPVEAQLVYDISSALINSGISQSQIGVIAPYRQQIKLLNRHFAALYPDVEILTADKSQGRDKDCIVMSLVRSNDDGQVGDLLKDWRRLNVCLTRAKAKLIVFGSRTTLGHVELLRRFFEVVDGKGWVYELPKEALPVKGVKRERDDETTPRKGAGAMVMRSPLVRDVVNSL